MATKLKKKKIVKKIETCEIPVIDDEPTQLPQFDNSEYDEEPVIMPECLTAERVKAAFDKEKHIEELRQKEQQSFICPAEHEVIVVIHHHHLEMEDESQTANREMEFWKKYKPERHYEIVRHGHYITYVIARRANKTEQVENLRKKKKVKA